MAYVAWSGLSNKKEEEEILTGQDSKFFSYKVTVCVFIKC